MMSAGSKKHTTEFEALIIFLRNDFHAHHAHHDVVRSSELVYRGYVDGLWSDETDGLEVNFWRNGGGGVDIFESTRECECARKMGVGRQESRERKGRRGSRHGGNCLSIHRRYTGRTRIQ
jgi:hypothetical protein